MITGLCEYPAFSSAMSITGNANKNLHTEQHLKENQKHSCQILDFEYHYFF